MIVVGARCAGSSVAMLLARLGHRVLILDRNAFPSDRLASTHMVWHSGVEHLLRWGLLDRLRATGCPAMRNFNLDLGELVLTGHAPPADGIAEAYAPRRFVLDDLLLAAAREAGAEVRTRCSVRDLVVDDDRVAGVRYADERGAMDDELDAFARALGERVRAAKRVSRWRTGCASSVCRASVGRGWCLLGDAGLTMDPITAAGITNAFRDASLLAELVGEGLADDLDSALANFQECRDALSVSLYQFTSEMARLAPPAQ